MSFNEKTLQDFVGTSNRRFENVKSKDTISDKKLKYFTYEFKTATNLVKLYFSIMIHKRLSNVPEVLQYLIVEHHRKMLSSFGLSPEACDTKMEIVH